MDKLKKLLGSDFFFLAFLDFSSMPDSPDLASSLIVAPSSSSEFSLPVKESSSKSFFNLSMSNFLSLSKGFSVVFSFLEVSLSFLEVSFFLTTSELVCISSGSIFSLFSICFSSRFSSSSELSRKLLFLDFFDCFGVFTLGGLGRTWSVSALLNGSHLFLFSFFFFVFTIFIASKPLVIANRSMSTFSK